MDIIGFIFRRLPKWWGGLQAVWRAAILALVVFAAVFLAAPYLKLAPQWLPFSLASMMGTLLFAVLNWIVLEDKIATSIRREVQAKDDLVRHAEECGITAI